MPLNITFAFNFISSVLTLPLKVLSPMNIYLLKTFLVGKLKLCRDERERIMRERNENGGVIDEDRKHITRLPRRSPGWKIACKWLITYILWLKPTGSRKQTEMFQDISNIHSYNTLHSLPQTTFTQKYGMRCLKLWNLSKKMTLKEKLKDHFSTFWLWKTLILIYETSLKKSHFPKILFFE